MRKELPLPEDFLIPEASAWMKEIETQMERYTGPCDGVYVDVGAHCGLVAVRAYLVGFRKIYCYEPASESYEFLKENLLKVSYPFYGPPLDACVIAHYLAVTGVTGQEFVLYDYDVPGDPGGSNTGMRAGSYKPGMRKIHSKTVTISLEDVISPHKEIEYLKVDIEGGEFAAFSPTETLRELLKRVKNISVELHNVSDPTFFDVPAFEAVHPWHSSAEAAGPELVDFLRECGFTDCTYDEAVQSPTEEFFSKNRSEDKNEQI